MPAPAWITNALPDPERVLRRVRAAHPDPRQRDAPTARPTTVTATYLDDPPGTQGATEENVKAGDTEVWEIYNTTGDVHPMHFHLVNVQVINRQLFDMSSFPGVSTSPVPSSRPRTTSWGGRRRCRCTPAR